MLQLLSNLAVRFPGDLFRDATSETLNLKTIWILPTLDVASIGSNENHGMSKEKQRKGEREGKREREREREERRREKTQRAVGLIKRTCGIKTIVRDNLNSSSIRLFSFFSL